MKVDLEISRDRSENTLTTGQLLGPAPYSSQSFKEIPRKGIWVIGFAIAVAGSFMIYRSYKEIGTAPVLGSLMFWAIFAPLEYIIVRRITFKAMWLWVSRSYPLVGRIHHAARGELPLGKYCLVLVIPWIVSIMIFVIAIIMELGKWPEIGLFVMLFLIAALEDIWAMFHCLRADRGSWVMESGSGLETLRPVG